MSNGKEKLVEDLEILEKMADEMAQYLEGDTLFGQSLADKVAPTIGGYLMRQHRLLKLQDDLLDSGQQERLNKATTQFDQAISEQLGRFTDKAYQELVARIRQWAESLQDQFEDPSMSFYRTDVEKRVIIEALTIALDQGAIKPELSQKIEKIDDKLRAQWRSGDFIWPEAWQPAYPEDDYWWLYGQIS